MKTIDLTKFTLKEIVGKGSFGEVRKVQDKETGEIYAAKISLDVLEVESEKDVRDFRREVNIMATVNHPSIVKFIGFNLTDFHNDPKPVIITEYMTKGSLSEVINLQRNMRSIWDETKKLINIYGIASAMAYLHSNEVYHRDLKPDNILMDDYLYPKISDFGLSKMAHKNEESMSMKSSTNIKGTPIYISPEILKNQKEYEKESDVYAFALIVYEIVTNDIPFVECKHPHEIYMKILEGHRPKFNYPLHESYQSLIERCWDQDPSQRPTFDEIVYELQNDPSYITDQIDEAEYLQYIDYIDECEKSFDKTKKMIHIDDFIKSKGGSIKKTTVDVKKESKLLKRSSESSSQIPKQKVEETVVKSFQRPTTSQKEDVPNKTVQRSMTLKNKDENHHSLTLNSKNKSQPIFEQYDRSQTLNPKKKKKSKSKFRSLFSRKSKSKPSLVHLPDNESNSLIDEAENDPEKQFLVGQYFIEGKNNFPKNIQNGITYLKMSIKEGCLEAVAYYCHMLIKGENIPKDIPKAKKTLKKYLKHKDASIYFLYGRIKVKEHERDKAIKYFEKASEGGNPKAMYNLAKVLFVKYDQLRNALYYFDMAKKNGYDKYYSFLSQLNATDAYHRGICFLTGQYVDINNDDAIRCFNIAISKGSTDAMVQMGSILCNGKIIKADKKKAFEYFSVAAKKENIDAMVYCGKMLINGDGVSVDEEKACNFFKKAADLRSAEGMLMYGECLEKGKGISPNKKDALLYYRKAADRGNKLASERYNKLNTELNSITQKSTLKTTNNSQTLSSSKGIANNNSKDSLQNSNPKLQQSVNSNMQRANQRTSQNSSNQRNDQRISQNSSNQRNDQRTTHNNNNSSQNQNRETINYNLKTNNQNNDQKLHQSSNSNEHIIDQRNSQNSSIQRNDQRSNQNSNNNYQSQSREIVNSSNDRNQNNNRRLYQNTNNSGQRIDQGNQNIYNNYQNQNRGIINNNLYDNNQNNNQNLYQNTNNSIQSTYQSNNQNWYPNNYQNQYQSSNQNLYPNNGTNQYQNTNYNRPNIAPNNGFNHQGFNQNNNQYFVGGQRSLDFSKNEEFVPNHGFYPPRQEPHKYQLNQEFNHPTQEDSDFKFRLDQDFKALSDDEPPDFKFRLDQDFKALSDDEFPDSKFRLNQEFYAPGQERSLNFGNNQNYLQNNNFNNQRCPQNINSNNQAFNQNANYNNNRFNQNSNFNNQISSSRSTSEYDIDESFSEYSSNQTQSE